MKKGFIFVRLSVLALAVVILLAAASCALAQSAYMIAPAELLAQPDAGAQRVGRIYAGTPVETGAGAGDYVLVRIGRGAGVMTGYVPASAVGADASGAQMRSVVSPYGTQAVVLRDRPSNSYDAVAMLAVGESVQVIGESGDFCFVIAPGGCAGCLTAAELR